MTAFRVYSESSPIPGHPLVDGLLAQAGSVPAFELALPVPGMSEIPAGFDAIFQFTTSVLDHYLNHIVGPTAWTVTSYDTTNLSNVAKQEILKRINARQPTSPTPTATPGGVTIVIGGGSTGGSSTISPDITELPNPLQLRITALRPSIDLPLAAGPFDAQVEWALDVEVGVPESQPSGGALGFDVGSGINIGVGLGGTGGSGNPSGPSQGGGLDTGGGTTLRFLKLTHGIADTPAIVRVETLASQYQTWARLDFSGSNVGPLASDDQLFGELLQGEVNQQFSNAVEQALAVVFAHPNLNICPRMALGGVLWSNEQLPGLQSFRVHHTSSVGNRPGRRVLSLCVNVGPNSANGDLALVRPFVAAKSFAYYVAEPIVQAALQVRRDRLPPWLAFTSQVPLDMELSNNAGTTIHGRGKVRFRIVDITDIDFAVTTVDLPDAIRLSGSAELTLLEAWDDANRKIQDLGTYANPETTPFAWRIYPFGGLPMLPPGPGQQFFESLTTQLIEPVDRPCAETIRVTEVEGEISGPLHALFARGQLSF